MPATWTLATADEATSEAAWRLQVGWYAKLCVVASTGRRDFVWARVTKRTEGAVEAEVRYTGTVQAGKTLPWIGRGDWVEFGPANVFDFIDRTHLPDGA
jgi:hypothetical protein